MRSKEGGEGKTMCTNIAVKSRYPNPMKTNASTGLAHLVSTFSIVAFDPITKDLGVAVQSCYFSVGSVVPWAESGVGAIATQANANVSYGPRGLELLKEGLNVEEVIGRLTRDDDGKELRQVGILDSKGNASAFTGRRCSDGLEALSARTILCRVTSWLGRTSSRGWWRSSSQPKASWLTSLSQPLKAVRKAGATLEESNQHPYSS